MNDCVAIPISTVVECLKCVWILFGVMLFGTVTKFVDRRMGVMVTIFFFVMAIALTIMSRWYSIPAECSSIIGG